MPVMVGMPVCNDLVSFRLAVESLIRSTDHPFKLVIVESESTDGSKEYADLIPKLYHADIEIIHTKKEGPLKAYNLLFDIAKERKMDLLLTQTDVIFPRLYKRDWLQQFVRISDWPNVGIVTTMNGGGMSGPTYVEGFPWVGGWCTFIPIETIEKIGKFDENFLIGDGVDIDYSYRVVKAGLRILPTDYWVDHHMTNTREHEKRADLPEIQKKNSEYFKKKFNLA
jgi:GT2 family glycosyltransferase